MNVERFDHKVDRNAEQCIITLTFEVSSISLCQLKLVLFKVETFNVHSLTIIVLDELMILLKFSLLTLDNIDDFKLGKRLLDFV